MKQYYAEQNKAVSTYNFNLAKRDAALIPLTPYAKFMSVLNGYDLYHNRKKIDKWEAWYICKDAGKIMAGLTRIQCVKR